jgi:hypothetical protein
VADKLAVNAENADAVVERVGDGDVPVVGHEAQCIRVTQLRHCHVPRTDGEGRRHHG